MEFNTLQLNPVYTTDKKLAERIDGFQQLIIELKKKEIPDQIVQTINEDIDAINSFTGSGKDALKLFRKKQLNILKLLEKQCKLVVKNHYRNLWLALGMSAFGIPIGAAIGIIAGNRGLLGIGLPIGLGIGTLVGAQMDKKALQSGKQLDVVLKY